MAVSIDSAQFIYIFSAGSLLNNLRTEHQSLRLP